MSLTMCMVHTMSYIPGDPVSLEFEKWSRKMLTSLMSLFSSSAARSSSISSTWGFILLRSGIYALWTDSDRRTVCRLDGKRKLETKMALERVAPSDRGHSHGSRAWILCHGSENKIQDYNYSNTVRDCIPACRE